MYSIETMLMAAADQVQRNLWALTVLCLLREAPIHPYEIQRLITERKKDEFLDLKRGSLYQNIGRLERAGLIAKVETTRAGKRPERTVYRLTEAGEIDLLRWLRDLLSRPERNSIPFAAAISFLAHLAPDDALKQLNCRAELLEAEVTGMESGLADLVPRLGRLLVLEAEFVRTMLKAELAWVRSLIGDIGRGDLTWNPAEFFPRRRPDPKPPV
jgi:DNA-binding PadR family transcriptional regulator